MQIKLNLIGKLYAEFVYSVIAGIMIGLGGCSLLAIENPVTGAIFFSFGLMSIIMFHFKLYTGLIGNYFDKLDNTSIINVILGNLCGTAFVGLIVNNFLPKLTARATEIVMNKADMIVNIQYQKAMFLGMLCGILMQTGVSAWRHKELETGFQKSFVTIMAVAVFIVAGFEHSIADMFYLFAAQANLPVLKQIYFIGFVIVGNGIGAVMAHELYNLKNLLQHIE